MRRQIIWGGVVLCGMVMHSAQAQQSMGNQQMSLGGNQSVLASLQQPVTDAQYQAEKVSKSVQTLSDGTVITHETRGMIARDAHGRVREDLYVVHSGSLDGKQTNIALQSATVGDPVAHTMLIWTGDKSNIVVRMQVPSLSSLPKKGLLGLLEAPPPPPPNGQGAIQMIKNTAPPPSNAMPTVRTGMPNSPLLLDIVNALKDDTHTEQLGKQSIEGVLVTGKRLTTTIPIGKVGNDRPIVVVHEEWSSPELKVVVKTIDTDPRTGKQTMELQGLTRTDPDPALFQAPAGYKVEDMAEMFKTLGDLGKAKAQ